MNKTALILIDLQNDYFPQGRYPLWNADEVLTRNIEAARRAHALGMDIITVQHVALSKDGSTPEFFAAGTPGVTLHSRLIEALNALGHDTSPVIKHYADSFHLTDLHQRLQALGIERLILTGMMTQNCVTHTALSLTGQTYEISVIGECCTTVDPMIHGIALSGLSTRVPIVTLDEAIPLYTSQTIQVAEHVA